MRFNLHVPNVNLSGFGGGGVTDHGVLEGLGDDDHTQYFNQARGDIRYALSGNYLTIPQGDVRYALSGTGGGVHTLLGAGHSDTTGTAASGHILGFDGSIWRPSTVSDLAGGTGIGELHRKYLPSGETLEVANREQVLVYESYTIDDGATLDLTDGGELVILSDTNITSISGLRDIQSTAWTSGNLLAYNGANFTPLSSGFFVGREELLQQYNLELDEAAGSITYIGEALPGTATSTAAWRIKRLDESDSIVELIITWADGNDNFDNTWNNRASLSYS